MSSLTSKEFDSYVNSGKILNDYYSVLDVGNVLEKSVELELIQQYIDSGRTDMRIRDKLFEANALYVISVAKRYSSYGFPLIDLIQEGNVGLLEGINRFDPLVSNNGRLINYANSWIQLYINRFIKINLKMTNFSKSNDREKLFFKLSGYITPNVKTMTTELANKISSDLNVKVEDVYVMYNYLSPYSHISNTIHNEDGEEVDLYDTIESPDGGSDFIVEQNYRKREMDKWVNVALSCLDENETLIIKRRLMVEDDEKPTTLQELGTHFGTSKEWVRQKEKKAIQKIKSHLEKAGFSVTSLFE